MDCSTPGFSVHHQLPELAPRGWDSRMASQIQWTWVWINSGVGDGQGGLACCSLWGHKRQTWLSDWTELNWTEKIIWEGDYIRVICPWAEEMPLIAELKPWGHLLWFFDQTVKVALSPSSCCLLFPYLRFRLLGWRNSGNSVRLYFLGLQNHCRWWLQPWN